jgi:hypothetical protein
MQNKTENSHAAEKDQFFLLFALFFWQMRNLLRSPLATRRLFGMLPSNFHDLLSEF